jgi:hypothetical protein
MPGFDRTGPRGLGPMTGRGLGYCVEPVGAGYGYGRAGIPFYGPPLAYQEPYGAYPYGAAPFRTPFWGGRVSGLRGRGRLFGRGRGFGRIRC